MGRKRLAQPADRFLRFGNFNEVERSKFALAMAANCINAFSCSSALRAQEQSGGV
jgi:hypothetical protein